MTKIKHRITGLVIRVVDGADLRWASLYGANLSWAYLHGADLRGADLRRADLRWANLYGANLRDADLHEADLSWAIYDDCTHWPVGFDLSGRGAVAKGLDNERKIK